jgi:hypothetical protein
MLKIVNEFNLLGTILAYLLKYRIMTCVPYKYFESRLRFASHEMDDSGSDK